MDKRLLAVLLVLLALVTLCQAGDRCHRDQNCCKSDCPYDKVKVCDGGYCKCCEKKVRCREGCKGDYDRNGDLKKCWCPEDPPERDCNTYPNCDHAKCCKYCDLTDDKKCCCPKCGNDEIIVSNKCDDDKCSHRKVQKKNCN